MLSLCCPYVELNPVRAGLVTNANQYEWSSTSSHRVNDSNQNDETLYEAIRKSSKTGRPCGSKDFIRVLEEVSGVSLTPLKRGPSLKPKKCVE